MAFFRKHTGLVAACLLALMGLGLFWGGVVPPVVGLPLAIIGALAAAWQANRLYQNRQDPYDLSRLYERDEETPEYDDAGVQEDDLLLCRHCGHGSPAHLRVCGECGNRLG